MANTNLRGYAQKCHSRIRSNFNKIIKIGFFALILGGLANCTGLKSAEIENQSVHFSQNPIFDETTRSYKGENQGDRGLSSNDNQNGDGGLSSNGQNPDGGLNGEPQEPFVVVEMGSARMPFQFCANGGFQVLRRDGEYTQCRPCLAEGTRNLNGKEVSVCEVQRCDQANQYVFFGDDASRPSRTCDRCDVMSPDNTRCLIVVQPPADNGSRRSISGIGGEGGGRVGNMGGGNDDDDDDRGGGSNRGGNDGGPTTGGGDPLMIDTLGVEYASVEALKNSDATYFADGELKLTNPEPIEGVDTEDIAQRATFEGFNLLGQQTRTALDNGTFLHINDAGKNFKFQKMSWTSKSQDRYRFLALPDENGHILGIDQLFGDNTYGPSDDQPFAVDGFDALAKFDLGDASIRNPAGFDRRIDKSDAVFSKLRLWHDKNGDGNVDNPGEMRDELVTLGQVGITFISLEPDTNYFETDIYGNDIAYKAIVGFESNDGKLKLGTAFDLWFQYDPREMFDIRGGVVVEE